MSQQATYSLVTVFAFLALGIVGVAAVSTFGWLRGFGVLAVVWLLTPQMRV